MLDALSFIVSAMAASLCCSREISRVGEQRLTISETLQGWTLPSDPQAVLSRSQRGIFDRLELPHLDVPGRCLAFRSPAALIDGGGAESMATR